MFQCKRKIKKVGYVEIQPMFPALINCRKVFGPKEVDVIVRTIKAMYSMEDVWVGEEEVIGTYIAVMEFLLRRLTEETNADKVRDKLEYGIKTNQFRRREGNKLL